MSRTLELRFDVGDTVYTNVQGVVSKTTAHSISLLLYSEGTPEYVRYNYRNDTTKKVAEFADQYVYATIYEAFVWN